MQIKIENLNEKCEIHFIATVDGDEWSDAQSKALRDLAQNVTVKGFRKGKAPVAQAAKYISTRDILDKAGDRAVNKAYDEMVKNNDIKPIMQPELVVNDFSTEKFSFTFVVVTVPVMKLGEYKGISVTKDEVSVSDADIDNELNSLADKNAELVVAGLDYAAVKGDSVVIDFKGYVDGEAFEGGEAKDFELSLGSNTFVPGFEDQLIGAKTNEDKDVVITFPDSYIANLANKEATFKVHINAVKQKVVPVIDDDFAKDLDIKDVDTLEQLKAHLNTQILDRKTRAADEKAVNTLIDMAVANASFECHDKIYQQDANRIIKDFENRLNAQGFKLDDYLAMSKKTKEDLNNEALVEAKKNTKRAYFLEEVAKVENITVSSEEVENKLEELAKAYHMTLDEIKKQLGDRVSSFAMSIKQDKIIEFLKNSNNI